MPHQTWIKIFQGECTREILSSLCTVGVEPAFFVVVEAWHLAATGQSLFAICESQNNPALSVSTLTCCAFPSPTCMLLWHQVQCLPGL